MSQQFDDRRVGCVIAGKYRVDKLIAQGGFSSVYRGVQLGMDRPVAIKVLELEQERGISPTWLQRFELEARIVCQLDCPSTITIYDFGREEGFLYIVMEYIRGRSLSRQIRKHGAIEADDTAVIGLAILRSLDEAHGRGILHRDLKPSNIMLGRDYNNELLVKVLDFGVAKLLESEEENAVQLTQAGTFVGTPRYASPEQMRRENLTPASDIYGVGLIMWECLTGKPPVPTTDFPTCIAHHLGPDPWRLPLSVECPADLAAVIHRALEKNHADRYQQCSEVLVDLERCVAASITPEMDVTFVEAGVPAAVAAYLSSPDDSLTSSDSIDFSTELSQFVRDPSHSSNELEAVNGSSFEPEAYFDPGAQEDELLEPTAKFRPVDIAPTLRLPDEELTKTEEILSRSKPEVSLLAPPPEERGPEMSQPTAIPRAATDFGWVKKLLLATGALILALGAIGGGVWIASTGAAPDVEAIKLVDEPKEVQPPLVPADKILMGMQTAKWKVGKIENDDLGDVQRTTTMVMKDSRVSVVTIYECDEVAVAAALLKDTQSPDEAVQFGRTLVRIAPGPSSSKSGVQRVTKMLFAYRGMMESSGDL